MALIRRSIDTKIGALKTRVTRRFSDPGYLRKLDDSFRCQNLQRECAMYIVKAATLLLAQTGYGINLPGSSPWPVKNSFISTGRPLKTYRISLGDLMKRYPNSMIT